jgi:hypothetical protein
LNEYRDENLKDNILVKPTKEKFLELVGIAMKRSFRGSVIRAGWRVAGIYPFDPNMINKEKILPSTLTDNLPGSDLNTSAASTSASSLDISYSANASFSSDKIKAILTLPRVISKNQSIIY